VLDRLENANNILHEIHDYAYGDPSNLFDKLLNRPHKMSKRSVQENLHKHVNMF